MREEEKYRLSILSPNENLEVSFSKEKIIRVLPKLAEQVVDFENYFWISERLICALNNKYSVDLSFRWYVFALNSMIYRMEMVCAKLLSPVKTDTSVYNLLKFLCQRGNYEQYLAKENRTEFETIIKAFNEKVLPVFCDIKKRRNKLNAHNDMVYLLNDKKRKSLAEMTNKIYLEALLFLKDCVSKLYWFYKKEDAFDIVNNEDYLRNCEAQIEQFVAALNDCGDLE